MVKKNKVEVHASVVSRLSKGDLEAYRQLYVLFAKKIYHTARKMKLVHEDAEEVVQDTFVKIWELRARLDPELSINAYLLAIVKTLVLKKFRKEANFCAFKNYSLHSLSEVSDQTVTDLIFEDLHQHSKELIGSLPAEQRKVFKLRYFEYKTADEIAAKLQVSKRTVENHLYRATKTIRRQLEEMKIISSLHWVALYIYLFG